MESEGQTLLYDGGPRSASSFVVSYLQERQISEIDYLISSHYDEDHVSGLIGCLNAFDVANVIGADYVHDSSLYDSFMDGVAAQGHLRYSIRLWEQNMNSVPGNLRFCLRKISAKRAMPILWQSG